MRMSDLLNNYIAVDVMCAIALIVLANASWHNVLLPTEMKKQFTLSALVTITVIIAEVSCVIFENNGLGGRVPILIVNAIGFSLSPVIAIVLSNAFSIEKSKIRSLLTIPVWINFVLVISSPWIGLIFNSNTDSAYFRGSLFVIFVVAYFCSYAILTITSIKVMKYFQCQSKSTFIMMIGFTIVGTTVQLILPDVHVAWLCVSLSLILFYAYFCILTQTQDTLTGLLTRNVYDQYARNLHNGDSGAVIVLDLDNFKRINDLHGHQWGDSCLRIVGSLIKDCFYKMGYCYRIGGDEFGVICDTTDEKKVASALKMFHRRVDETRKTNNLQGELPMVSTGYDIFYGSTKEFNEAAKKADAQMYNFKKNRNQDKLQNH